MKIHSVMSRRVVSLAAVIDNWFFAWLIYPEGKCMVQMINISCLENHRVDPLRIMTRVD